MKAALTLRDAVQALAALPDDVELTLTVTKGDLARALEARAVEAAGGPEALTTIEAAARHGYTADRWRRWAAAGRIAGAWQDAEGGSWHLPRASCAAHVASLQQRGRHAPSDDAASVGSGSSSRSKARGPRSSTLRQLARTARTTRASRAAGGRPALVTSGASADAREPREPRRGALGPRRVNRRAAATEAAAGASTT